MAPTSLTAKLARIYVEVDRFAKTKTVSGSGPSFKYTPVEEIADELRKKMGDAGIVMVPSHIEVVASEDAGTTKSGTTRWRHVVLVDWTLTDGTDSLTVSSVGESMDTGDKGMNKAQTAARKYALIGAFQLSTGDDPDTRHPEPAEYRRPAARKAPEDPVKARFNHLRGFGGSDEEIVARLRKSGVNASAELADDATWDRVLRAFDTAAGAGAEGKLSDPPGPPDEGTPALAASSLGGEL